MVKATIFTWFRWRPPTASIVVAIVLTHLPQTTTMAPTTMAATTRTTTTATTQVFLIRTMSPLRLPTTPIQVPLISICVKFSKSSISGLKPVLKQSVDNTPEQQQQQISQQQAQVVEEKPVGKKVELRVGKNPQQQQQSSQQQQQQVELRVNKNPLRPRPRSVAVPNAEAVRAEEV